jgi:hypothetical protein
MLVSIFTCYSLEWLTNVSMVDIDTELLDHAGLVDAVELEVEAQVGNLVRLASVCVMLLV